ncbi:unnamed protein product [Strongylus vulgaris]|uniref:Uncharacterized protein n=1 Tax=Strongylus vulgaris TaxID=40348 RepID=A0A3P7JFX1_STRVU|nr:unnamed protein product [Strongylus vulgaris]
MTITDLHYQTRPVSLPNTAKKGLRQPPLPCPTRGTRPQQGLVIVDSYTFLSNYITYANITYHWATNCPLLSAYATKGSSGVSATNRPTAPALYVAEKSSSPYQMALSCRRIFSLTVFQHSIILALPSLAAHDSALT